MSTFFLPMDTAPAGWIDEFDRFYDDGLLGG